jgi:hypothetical protein
MAIIQEFIEDLSRLDAAYVDDDTETYELKIRYMVTKYSLDRETLVDSLEYRYEEAMSLFGTRKVSDEQLRKDKGETDFDDIPWVSRVTHNPKNAPVFERQDMLRDFRD